jgi:hypothetical protein
LILPLSGPVDERGVEYDRRMDCREIEASLLADLRGEAFKRLEVLFYAWRWKIDAEDVGVGIDGSRWGHDSVR